MCGIIGTIINKKPLTQIKVVEQLYANQKNRGKLGYGMANITKMRRIRSTNLKGILGWERYHFIKKFKKGDVLMFHHRYPTSTKNTEKTAHPFFNENKTIALMHNGVINNYRELHDKLVKEGHRFESEEKTGTYNDSEVILHQFEKLLKETNDVTESMNGLINTLKGTFAIVIAFKGEHRVHLLKNNNPIIVSADKHENYYFSSELEGYSNHYSNYKLKEGEVNKEGQQLVHNFETGQYGILDKEGLQIIKTFDIPKPEPTKTHYNYINYNNPQKTIEKNNYQEEWFFDYEKNIWVNAKCDKEKIESKRASILVNNWTKLSRRIAGRILEEINWEAINDYDIWDVYGDLESTMIKSKNMRLTKEDSDKLWNFFLGWLNYNKPYFYELIQKDCYETEQYNDNFLTQEELEKKYEKEQTTLLHDYEKPTQKELEIEEINCVLEETIEETEKKALEKLFYGG